MITAVLNEMINYYQGDAKRISHFIKVHAFAKMIALDEGVDQNTLQIIEIAAYVHDIGIKNCMMMYNSCTGKLQEVEGAKESKILLNKLNINSSIIDQVSYLVAHHHTYTFIDAIDYQILVEADFLVNFYENQDSKEHIKNVLTKVFKTNLGKQLCIKLYNIEN